MVHGASLCHALVYVHASYLDLHTFLCTDIYIYIYNYIYKYMDMYLYVYSYICIWKGICLP
jgi:hypothetical protein